MGYIITKGKAPKTYLGYRCATSDMEVNQGEKFIESLEGYSQEVLELPLTLEDKRLQLVDSFKALPIQTRVAFQTVAVTVDTALKLGDVELALYNLEGAKTVEGANVALLQSMIDLINT